LFVYPFDGRLRLRESEKSSGSIEVSLAVNARSFQSGQVFCPSFGIAVTGNSRLEDCCGVRVGNQASTVFADDFCAPKGLAMLIRSEMTGIDGEAALAAPGTIPAASLPTLLIGLLLTCP
jgi:hypothetical protein